MAISTIDYDVDGQPKHAKYCIVALGNLSCIHWNKGDIYEPAISMIGLRLLTSIAVWNKWFMQFGDVKQAFVQATLPHGEIYIIHPSKGCTQTHPQDFWQLNKLYCADSVDLPSIGMKHPKRSSRPQIFTHAKMPHAYFMEQSSQMNHQYTYWHHSTM